eukprot:6202502-Pleurochrysis_carterae.AAC.3
MNGAKRPQAVWPSLEFSALIVAETKRVPVLKPGVTAGCLTLAMRFASPARAWRAAAAAHTAPPITQNRA